MSITVGIPRAMSYYYLFPYYWGFLKTLGVQVEVSAPTTGRTLERMRACPTDEPCISVKLAFAHAKELLDRGVDCLFVPALASVDQDNFCCPKHIGLPYMLKNGLKLSDEQLIIPRFDMRLAKDGGKSSFVAAAQQLGCNDDMVIEQALLEAERAQREFQQLAVAEQLTAVEAIARLCGEKAVQRRQYDKLAQYDEQTVTGIVAHSYTLHDPFSHDLVGRLREHGPVLTPEMVAPDVGKQEVRSIWQGERLWSFEIGMLGAGLHWLREDKVQRLVMLGPFECGPEAIIQGFLEDEAEKYGVPLLLLTVDELTAEAGLATRIEAFFDTSQRGVAKTSRRVQRTTAAGRVVTTPSMGVLDVGLCHLFRELGVDHVPAPPLTRKTVDLGMELAPEFICYPMVTTIGQMRQALDQGANTILMVGGKGRCRLGWYAQVQEQLLKRWGYDFDMIIIDSPFPLRKNWARFVRDVREVLPEASWGKIFSVGRTGLTKIRALDDGEAMARQIRAWERERGTADRLLREFRRDLDEAVDLRSVRMVTNRLERDMGGVEVVNGDPIRIRVVGEVYVVVERFVNMDLDQVLGSLPDARVLVEREISTSWWMRGHLWGERKVVNRNKELIAAASSFLPEPVGGHGAESVGYTALAKDEGIDGVIHLMPFTCMPEIVAQNIITRVAEDLDVPVLTLIISEQTGKAGVQTRIEAFVDVLAERRYRMDGGNRRWTSILAST